MPNGLDRLNIIASNKGIGMQENKQDSNQPVADSGISRLNNIAAQKTKKQLLEDTQTVENMDKQITGVYNVIDKMYKGALDATFLPQGERLINMNYEKTVDGKLTPKGMGEMAQDVLTLPYNVATSIPGIPIGALMGATGANEAMAKGINTLSDKPMAGGLIPSPRELVSSGMQVGFMLPGLPHKRIPLSPKIPIDINIPKTPISSPIKISNPQLAIPASIPQNIQNIKDTASNLKGTDIKGEAERLGTAMKETGAKRFEIIKEEVYKPMRDAVNKVPVPKNVGDLMADKIKSSLEVDLKNGDIDVDDFAKASKILDNFRGKGNLDQILRTRTTFREKAGEVYKDSPKAGDFIKEKVYNEVTDAVRGYIKDPELLKQFNTANKIYGFHVKDAIDLKNAYKKDVDVLFEKEVLRKDTKRIAAAKNQFTPELIKAAGFNYLSGKSFEEGVFNAKKFRTAVIDDIGNVKGRQIFGDDWESLTNMAKDLTPGKIEATVTGIVPALDKYINLFGKWRDWTKGNLYLDPNGKGIKRFFEASALKTVGQTTNQEQRDTSKYYPSFYQNKPNQIIKLRPVKKD